MAFAPLPPFYTYLPHIHPEAPRSERRLYGLYYTAKGEKEAVAVNEAAKASRFD